MPGSTERCRESTFAAASASRETLERQQVDEVIISTLPTHVSHWLRLDLPARVKRLGVPVTVITARKASRRLAPVS